ncbi:MAG: cation:proton antiporter [Desulfobacterota bacterium]|nr:cation:proton antiporter [Thermodesulfobacteriota bacterium]
METQLFVDILYILFLSVVALFFCNRLRIPTIAGLLLVGVLEGPAGLHLVYSVHEVEKIAEIGVVFLMFTIGVEFSLEHLQRLRRVFFIGGTFQTIGTFCVACALLWTAGMQLPQAVFVSMLLSLSSTAIVLRLLQQRGDIDSPQGRTALSILIYQDLLVIPMMLIIPFLAGTAVIDTRTIGLFIAKASICCVLIVGAAKWILPRMLHQIARTRDPELFFISIVFLVFAIAFATSSAGLSLALGAFLAGLILSSSPYGQRALGHILPFRDLFMSFFFVSIGMLLKPAVLATQPLLIAGGTVLLCTVKCLIVVSAALLLGMPLRSAVLCGLSLVQVGEFSFVLARAGMQAGVLSADHFQTFLAVSILSMLVTPLLIAQGETFVKLAMRLPLPDSLKAGKAAETPGPGLVDHLVIIGFGLGGRHIADAAEAAGIPYVVIDTNPDTVRSERAAGRRIYHGDATCEPILIHAGIQNARVAVIAISDPVGTNRVVEQVRLLNPRIHIIVRIRYFAQADTLLAFGADEVIPEEYEASIEIFTRVLHKYLVPKEEIDALVHRVRERGYQMLRAAAPIKPAMLDLDLYLSGMEVRVMRIHEHSNAIGRTLAELNLRKDYGITVLAINRQGRKISLPDGEERFAAGDNVVLLGMPDLLVFADTIFGPGQRDGEG